MQKFWTTAPPALQNSHKHYKFPRLHFCKAKIFLSKGLVFGMKNWIFVVHFQEFGKSTLTPLVTKELHCFYNGKWRKWPELEILDIKKPHSDVKICANKLSIFRKNERFEYLALNLLNTAPVVVWKQWKTFLPWKFCGFVKCFRLNQPFVRAFFSGPWRFDGAEVVQRKD